MAQQSRQHSVAQASNKLYFCVFRQPASEFDYKQYLCINLGYFVNKVRYLLYLKNNVYLKISNER